MKVSNEKLHILIKVGDSDTQDMATELLLLRDVWEGIFHGGPHDAHFSAAMEAYQKWLTEQS